MLLKMAHFYSTNSITFEAEYDLKNGNYDWIVWPAIGLNKVFTKLFGKTDVRFWRLFTWRSCTVTALLSLLSNMICVLLIFNTEPKDFQHIEFALLRIVVNSYLVFILFNFIGDWFSVNVSRYILNKIVLDKRKLFWYLSIDMGGIAIGYLITLLPSYSILLYCLVSGDELNIWIQRGLLGNAIIPFFLFIFSTTNLSWIFAFFSIIAVFSVTIPTFSYMFLILFCYSGYHSYRVIFDKNDSHKRDIYLTKANTILKSLINLSGFLIIIFGALVALTGLL